MKIEDINIAETKIETARLILRPFEEKDTDDLFEFAQVAGVGEAAGWNHHETREQSAAVVQAFIAGHRTFAIAEKESGKVIGSIGFEPCSDIYKDLALGENVINIGYVLGQKYWGMGYANEVVRGILSYAFYVLHLDAVTCAHFKGNESAKNVLLSRGLKQVAEGKYTTQSGKEYDALFYAIKAAEYGVEYKPVINEV